MSKRDYEHELLVEKFKALVKKAEEGDFLSMRLLAKVYTESEYFPREYYLKSKNIILIKYNL